MNVIKNFSLILVFLLANTSLVFSQEVKVVDISKTTKEPTIMVGVPEGSPKIVPDVKPEFRGGERELNLYVSKNLKYPKEAINNNIQGLLVVQITIAKDGTAKFDQFVRKLGYGCEEEVQRLIRQMPKWKPALLMGKPVDSDYMMRVSFKLTD